MLADFDNAADLANEQDVENLKVHMGTVVYMARSVLNGRPHLFSYRADAKT